MEKYKNNKKEKIKDSINTSNFLNTIKSSELIVSLESEFNNDKDIEVIINKFINLKRQIEKITISN